CSRAAYEHDDGYYYVGRFFDCW
nr:immunoglobulin heavy chain junction region [Macaca mulatta]MOX59714.1 immunoglobulin heavy chain junction region [Macaca mulatta]MOX60035.1 immunoglobulin heavy chain junction region [Macaca mulatta]MOX60264.1 immunoglobulin heavy chain junction region [Macaca mulatta]MOX60320.1 immunoglobulin heavy chain junction region [Macaca mulatta]